MTYNLTNNALITEVGQMPVHWCEQIVTSAHRGSDDELWDLIREIPTELNILQKVFSHLTNEFLFEEIIRVISSVAR